MLTTVGLFAESKPEFSLRIHPLHDAFVPTDTAITIEVTTTNLTDRTLDPMKFAMPYTYIVRRNGVLVPENHPYPETIGLPKGLPPHRSATGDVYVNQHRDMSQPGKYTIQLQEGAVKSNVVTVTVEP